MFKPEGFSTPVLIDVRDINPRPASEVRVRCDAEAIEHYKERLDGLGAVHVVVDAEGTHWLADGRHRWEASKAAKRKQIWCCVKSGTYLEAYRHACRANDEHGVRVTNADKRHRVIRSLENPDLAGKGNTEIADLCAVTEHLVRKLRPERVSNSTQSNSTPPDSDHRTQKEKRDDVLSTIDAHPDWSNKRVADACDVSRELVAKVRKQLEAEASELPAPRSSAPPVPDSEPESGDAKEAINSFFPSNGHAEHTESEPETAREPGPFDTFEAFRLVEIFVYEAVEQWPEAERAEFAFQLHALSSRIDTEFGAALRESN